MQFCLETKGTIRHTGGGTLMRLGLGCGVHREFFLGEAMTNLIPYPFFHPRIP